MNVLDMHVRIWTHPEAHFLRQRRYRDSALIIVLIVRNMQDAIKLAFDACIEEPLSTTQRVQLTSHEVLPAKF